MAEEPKVVSQLATQFDRDLSQRGAGAAFDGLVAALSELSRIRQEARAAHREQQRLRRNARARARYATRKAAGTLPARHRAPVELVDDDRFDYPRECYCPSTSPPCSWCERAIEHGCPECGDGGPHSYVGDDSYECAACHEWFTP